MNLRVLIVDDEEFARAALEDLLAERSDVTVVGEADSIQSAVVALQRWNPEVVFLDVTLSDGDAFELFDRVPVDAHVIFLTASDEHAVRAFEVNALDYLVKPTRPRHLDRALARAQGTARATSLDPVRLTPGDWVRLRESHSTRFCRVGDILFIRAANDYTEVRLVDGATPLVHRRLRDWMAQLPDPFAQCHRSTLVNLDYLEALDVTGTGATYVRLRSVDERLPVSRRLLAGFKAQVARFVRN
ncbi:MAG: LytTR family DNA-binding domain-containing protein [Myxococcota bacterium]